MRDDKRAGDSGLAWPWAAGMAVVAGLIRLVPHPPNFTPVGALGLFGGARLRPWLAFTLPFAVMAVTDLLLWGLDEGKRPFNPFVYGSFLVNVVLGRLLLPQTNSPWRIGAVSLAGAVQFFLVTNFGVWIGGHGQGYPMTLAGLAKCYGEGLPFFGYTVAGDLFFAAVVFGLYAVLQQRALAREASQPA
jgi:hypothetical protein